MTDKIISKLEKSLGGKAPFRVVDYWVGTCDKENGIYDMGTCANCGRAIIYVSVVKDSKNKSFQLGSSCVVRVGGEKLWKEHLDAKDLMKWGKHDDYNYKEAKAEQEKMTAEWKADEKARELKAEKKRKAELKRKSISKHVGSVGERQEFTATVQFRTTGEGQFGQWCLTVLEDESKNRLSYFNALRIKDGEQYQVANEGDKVSFKATVKAHDTYKGEKQTSLSRCGKADLVYGREI